MFAHRADGSLDAQFVTDRGLRVLYLRRSEAISGCQSSAHWDDDGRYAVSMKRCDGDDSGDSGIDAPVLLPGVIEVVVVSDDPMARMKWLALVEAWRTLAGMPHLPGRHG